MEKNLNSQQEKLQKIHKQVEIEQDTSELSVTHWRNQRGDQKLQESNEKESTTYQMFKMHQKQ
jgi:hypothetical protein